MPKIQDLYDDALRHGLQRDEAQAAAVHVLDMLFQDLMGGASGKGAYLYGPVGRGKSLIMQYLFEAMQETEVPARRVHFHGFMEELHERMHKLGDPNGKDPMRVIAEDIVREAKLLCFDEFYITNIADAMLLGRLMEHLFAVGCTVCATSNWAMDDLFQGGLNRDRFMPFIKLMEQHLQPVEVAGKMDYRTLGEDGWPLWKLEDKGGPKKGWTSQSLRFYGQGRRSVYMPEFPKVEQVVGSAAHYTFESLCGDGVGREVYLEMADLLTTLIVSDMPHDLAADEALRFITLVDVWYEAGRRLLVVGVCGPEEIEVAVDAEGAFGRCVSRLREMQGWG